MLTRITENTYTCHKNVPVLIENALLLFSVEEGVTKTTPTHPTLHPSDYYLVKTLAH